VAVVVQDVTTSSVALQLCTVDPDVVAAAIIIELAAAKKKNSSSSSREVVNVRGINNIFC
jgi:hypothetical protein